MQVLFVLRFYYPNEMDKIDRLIHVSLEFKKGVKMSSVVKQLLYVLKLFRVTAGCIHSFRIFSDFRICSKETLRIMYQKYPVLNIILEESTSVVDHSHQ